MLASSEIRPEFTHNSRPMTKSFDLTTYADSMSDAAQAINLRVFNQLSSSNYDRLHDLSNVAKDLFIQSKTLYDLETIQLTKDASNSMTALAAAAEDVENTIKTSRTLQIAIDLASEMVLLAEAISSGDSELVTSRATDVFGFIKQG